MKQMYKRKNSRKYDFNVAQVQKVKLKRFLLSLSYLKYETHKKMKEEQEVRFLVQINK